jgi:hypothetical protein
MKEIVNIAGLPNASNCVSLPTSRRQDQLAKEAKEVVLVKVARQTKGGYFTGHSSVLVVTGFGA